MRLDRLLTLYFFAPLSRLLGQQEGLRIPILMYHSVSDRDEDAGHPYFVTNTKPEVFSRQMQYLADNGYTVISLSTAVSLLAGHSSSTGPLNQLTEQPVTSPGKYVVLTWDDGYRDFHDTAWPILKKYSFTATMFLPTGLIGNDRKTLENRECMTWAEIEALAAERAEVGAHTVSHVQLYDLYWAGAVAPDPSVPRRRESIEKELQISKQTIEEKLGKPVDHYAYALAFPEHDEEFLAVYVKALRDSGYRSAVSTRSGTAKRGDNRYTLKRIPVNTLDDIPLFRAKLEGGYDWMNALQLAVKKVKGIKKTSGQP